jgi:MFS family permease
MSAPSGNEPSKKPEITSVPGDALEQPRRMPVGAVSRAAMLASLQHTNYRIFFFGQIISLTGTWMQMVAEGWLVYNLTRSPLALGVMRFLHTIPVTLFTFYGGVLADRFEKRNILVITQCFALILSLLLYFLTAFGDIQVWQVGIIAFGLGMTNAFDIPARQSFVVDMVGKKDLTNAIALNSSVFNSARIIGPAIAGIILSRMSVAACFLINAVSYAAVIMGYLTMKLPLKANRSDKRNVSTVTREAVQWIWQHTEVRIVFLLVSMMSLFGMAYTALMPVFAKDILKIGPEGFGWLLTANGVGALVGSFTLAAFGPRVNRNKLSLIGLGVFLICMIVFAWSRNPWMSAAILVIAGWGMIIFFATSNTLVQSHVSDSLRGRVMGIYSFCFIGLSPFGNFISGAVAKWVDAPFALTMGCLIGFVFFVWAVFLGRREIS